MSTSQQISTESPKQPDIVVDVTTAGFFERIAAACIDLVLPIGLGLVTLFLWPKPAIMERSEWNSIDRFIDGYNVDSSLVWMPLTVGALSALAWNLFHGLRGREPFGRRLLKLKLINKAGQTPSQREITLHCAARIISALTFMLGHLWLLADPEKRTLHDRIAGLYLVHEQSQKTPNTPPDSELIEAQSEATP